MSTFHCLNCQNPAAVARYGPRKYGIELAQKPDAMSDTERSFLFWGGIVAITLAFYRFAVFVTPQ